MKPCFALLCLLVPLAALPAFSAEPLAPGVYTGPAVARKLWRHYWFTLTVATNGSTTAMLSRVSPVTGNVSITDDLGAGTIGRKGVVRGGAWGLFSWRALNLDGTNVSVRLWVYGASTPVRFDLAFLPPPPPEPPPSSGAVMEAQRRILEQHSSPVDRHPPTSLPPLLGRQWVAPPPPGIPSP